MARLFFKLEYTVQELMIPSEAVLTFEYGGPHEVRVVLRAPSGEEQAKGHSASHALCTALSAVEPDERVRDVFEKIMANQIIPADSDSTQVSIKYSTQDGSQVRLPTLSDFPKYFRIFISKVLGELSDMAVRTISVLRWRANELGPHNPISTRGLDWSIDGTFWHPAPADFEVRVRILKPLRASEQLSAFVDNVVKSGGRAPLHHDLFRESWEQRDKNPRSALVIGMAAAELSVKHCISTLVPDAGWLAINLPTPPLIRILNEYLPKMPARCKLNGRVKPPPVEVVKTLQEGITIRNQLSHAGASNPSIKVVEEILLAVHDLLWLIDFYSGSEWALGFLRPETRVALLAS